MSAEKIETDNYCGDRLKRFTEGATENECEEERATENDLVNREKFIERGQRLRTEKKERQRMTVEID
jgi:hypothetical protein